MVGASASLASQQEVAWAAKRVLSASRLEPVENACVECMDSVTTGWGITFAEALAKARADESFRQEVVQANEIRLRDETSSALPVEDVFTVVRSGRRVSQGDASISSLLCSREGFF